MVRRMAVLAGSLTEQVAIAFATRPGVLLAYRTDALEAAGKIFHLPALICANLMAWFAAAAGAARCSLLSL
jgi:hypothetical protein